jgi:hypothetical protein
VRAAAEGASTSGAAPSDEDKEDDGEEEVEEEEEEAGPDQYAQMLATGGPSSPDYSDYMEFADDPPGHKAGALAPQTVAIPPS